MRIALSAGLTALGATALIGSAQAGPAMPGNSAAAPVYEAAADIGTCPQGWRWDPAHYNRWTQWQAGRCVPARG
ncbi:MAG TPA: hypothetical protein VJ770_07620 [Stellaceae bacterium]|nr:hypothetical protein [Stellaceae bacterium]